MGRQVANDIVYEAAMAAFECRSQLTIGRVSAPYGLTPSPVAPKKHRYMPIQLTRRVFVITLTSQLLGRHLSIELTVSPPAAAWLSSEGGYEAGPYRLELETIARDPDTALLSIHLWRQDGEPFVLHNLKISFEVPHVDVHGTWDAQADPVEVQRQQMMPIGLRMRMGDGTTAAHHGVPLKMFLNRSGENRWLVGTLNQDDETRIDVRPDMRTGVHHVTVQRLPTERPARPFGPPPPAAPPAMGVPPTPGAPQPMGPFPGTEAPLQFALHTSDYKETVYLSRTPVDWYEAVQTYIRTCDEISGFVRPPFPEAAYEPVFCTWYAVLKDVTAEWTERAAAIAADLGFRTLILDDGWFAADAQGFGYRYAGDWVPAPSRFPDMAGHIRRVQAMGLKYIIWVAPFMVGRASHAAQSMAEHVISDGQPGFATGMGIQNLCPCNPEAREHIQGTLLALMGDYPLDGFKLDFIDAVGTMPCKAEHPHDFDAPGRAMHATLRGVYDTLRSQNPDVLVEFRQTYANLALRDCATMYRGFDVPFDFDANRWNITMTRAVAGGVPVHADPVYWQTDELDENVARHMITAMFAVPTVSVDFERLPGRAPEDPQGVACLLPGTQARAGPRPVPSVDGSRRHPCAAAPP